MVGDVLTKRRNITEKNGDNYNLKGFAELTETEIEKLISVIAEKLPPIVDETCTGRLAKVFEELAK